jgi:hypothetical protein
MRFRLFHCLSIIKRFSAGFQSLMGMVHLRETCFIAKYTTFKAELSSGNRDTPQNSDSCLSYTEKRREYLCPSVKIIPLGSNLNLLQFL